MSIIALIYYNESMIFPDFYYEKALWQKGFEIIGIDEVGRGAFAGPVCVGGVVFDYNLSSKVKNYLSTIGINDSKKLTHKKRESFASIIKEYAAFYDTVFIDVPTINKIGIGKATFLGMQKLTQNLQLKIQNSKNLHALVDGFEIPNLKIQQTGIVRGDSLSISIAAASIIAKVERDQMMRELGSENPNYQWEKNKGYGTLYHRTAIVQHGQTPLHRTDFCRNVRSSLVVLNTF